MNECRKTEQTMIKSNNKERSKNMERNKTKPKCSKEIKE